MSRVQQLASFVFALLSLGATSAHARGYASFIVSNGVSTVSFFDGTGGAGDTNHLVASTDIAGGIILYDSNNPITPQTGCVAWQAGSSKAGHGVRCGAGTVPNVLGVSLRGGNDLLWVDHLVNNATRISAQGGNGNDYLRVDNYSNVTLYGDGAWSDIGDDTIYASGGAGTLDGGPGDDYIAARGGGDVIRGGSGNDRIVANDTWVNASIDCGSGFDFLARDNGDTWGTNCETWQ